MASSTIPHASGIYKITCTVNAKIYVGSSQNILKRWWQHLTALSGGYHKNIYLQRAYEKYGRNNFEIEVVELITVEHLFEREQYWIDTLNTSLPIGFNIAECADSNMRGRKVSFAARKKMSVAHTGKKLSAATCEKMSIVNKGKKLTLEHREKISRANRGKKRSGAARAKISQSHIGLRQSIETIEKRIQPLKKSFIAISPDGTEYRVIGLREFCLEHGLSNGHMVSVAQGKRSQHKGWKCKYDRP